MAKIPIGVVEVKRWLFPGSQVTWAGEGTRKPFLCFGKEDGSLEHRDFDGNSLLIDPNPHELNSINGLAFSSARDMVAVSTGSEIFITRSPLFGGEDRSIIHPQGAHGVIATHRGGFIAPVGVEGAVLFEAVNENIFRKRSFKSKNKDVYFYKLSHVGVTERGEEIIACAGRNDGLLTITLKSDGTIGPLGRSTGRNSEFNLHGDVDIVDICPIPSSRYPFAVLALGINNTLHFTADIRHENPSVGVRLREMEGTAYTLLTVRGHLLLLTSEEFYILPDLGSLFLNGKPFDGKVDVFSIPIDALDCSIAYGELILLIVDGGVNVLEISKLFSSPNLTTGDPPQFQEESILEGFEKMTPDSIDFSWEPMEASIPQECDAVSVFASLTR